MRYCGNCGVQLFEASLVQERCLSCGAAITREGDIVSADQAARIVAERWHEVEPEYRTTQPQLEPEALAPASGEALATFLPATHAVPTATPSRQLSLVVLSGSLLGVLALLSLVIALLSIISTPSSTTRGIAIFATSTTISKPHKTPVVQHTPLPGIQATATASRGSTPQPSPTPGGPPKPTPLPGGTPTPVPMVVPSPTPIPSPTPGTPADITLSPTSSSNLLCLNSTTNFYIVNTGSSPLNWTVAVHQGNFTLAPPTSGTLASGAQQNIIVSGISGSGQIQVSDPNAANSPQYFTITCTL